MSHDEEGDSDAQPDRSRDRLPLGRRDYLRYTGAAAVGSFGATGGVAGQSEEQNQNNDEEQDQNDIEGQLTATGLQVNYEQSPNNLRPGRDPRFFWTNPQGTQQGAYRILVAESASQLRNGIGNVWDSGRVESTQSTSIEYRGAELNADTKYHWMVRIWDKDGDTSGWSEPASFTTALPEADDAWEGTWIGQEPKDSLPEADWTDYAYESDFTIENKAAGFIFRAQDADNFYMWQINTSQGPTPLLRPHVRVNGSWQTLDPVSLKEVMGDNPYRQHHLRIEIDGDQFTTYINDQQVDQRTDSTHARGSIGFRQSANADEHARYDNLQVTGPNGDILFSDSFEHEHAQHFTDGKIVSGQLVLDSTGVVFLSEHRGEKRLKSPLLRTETAIERSIAKARAHVITLGYGELYINGEHVGNEKLNPAWTAYGDRVLYTTHDIGDILRTGDNAIGLWLGRGWFSKSISNWNSFGAPRALMQLNITYENGSTDTVVTDTSWQLGRGPISENDIYDGETYDARREQSGWTEPGFNDGDWNSAKEFAPPSDDVKRHPQRIQPIKVTETLEPESLIKREGGYIVDFGQNHTGWVELSIDGADTGDKITIEHAEILENRGTRGEDDSDDVVVDDWEMLPGGSGDIYTGNLRSAEQTDVYIAKGADDEVYEPRFTYHGFRYAKVIGYPGELTKDDIRSKVVHTESEQTGSFTCSNDDLNQVQENSLWGQRSVSQSLPVDCCQRNERMGWTADAHMTARANLFNFDAYRMFGKYMDDHDANQGPEGTQSDTIPHGYGSRPADPNWARTRVTIPWFMYLHSGDTQVLSDHYDGMKQYIDYWAEVAENHIIPSKWNTIGDWLTPRGSEEKDNDPALLNTFAHYQTTETFAQIAETLGKKGDAKRYRNRAAAIAEAFNSEFFDPNANSYGSGDMTAYALPLYMGIVPDDHEEEVAKELVATIQEEYNGKIGTGFVGTRPLLFTLVDHGYVNIAYQIVSQPEEPGWVFMIKNGATTHWERWDAPDYGTNLNSLNHRNWTLISEWFYRVLAGINVAEPGFERINITPHVVDDLDHAGGEVDTIRGTVASRWEKVGAKLNLDVTIPGNTTAEIHIPAKYKQAVTEGGTPATEVGSLSFLHEEDEFAVFEAGSGEYQFLADPVRGSAGFVRDRAQDLLDLLDSLVESGQLKKGWAKSVENKLQSLQQSAETIIDAREAGNGEDGVAAISKALRTLSKIERWVTRQSRKNRLSDDTVSQFETTIADIREALLRANELLLDLETTLETDESIRAGGVATMTATITNNGDATINDLSMSVKIPEGWTVSPTGRTKTGSLKPGETFSVTYDLAAPVNQPSEANVELTGTAEYQYRGRTESIPITTTVTVNSPIQIDGLTAEPDSVEPGGKTKVATTIQSFVDSTVSGIVSLELPDGWKSNGGRNYKLSSNGSQTVMSTVTLPEDAMRGMEKDIQATAQHAGHIGDQASTGVSIPLQPLPNGFSTYASTEARFGMDDEAFVIRANGVDIWDGVDEYGVIYRQDDQIGDKATVTVRVLSQESTDPWAKAGLMVRNDITEAGESAGYAAFMITGDNGFEFEWDSNGDGYVDTASNKGESTYPCWLRLEKTGSSLTSYYSTDGDSWSEVGSATVPGMADISDVAMFSTAHTESKLGYTKFESYSIDSS